MREWLKFLSLLLFFCCCLFWVFLHHDVFISYVKKHELGGIIETDKLACFNGATIQVLIEKQISASEK